MNLQLTPENISLGLGLPASLLAVGGTPPYVYKVLSGGAGGTINSSTGEYESPQSYGKDIIEVKDSLGNISRSNIFVSTALELFCDVIQREMGLEDDHVYLWDLKINAPTDEGLFVAVSVLSAKPFGNKRVMDEDGNDLQSVNMQVDLSVDIISRSTAARDRKEEVIMALNSTYAESQQELNSFRIFPLSSSFVNLSQIDGAAIPYRFNIVVKMQYFVLKTKAIPYYDNFADTIVVNS